MNLPSLKIDINIYFIVRHKDTDRFYAVRKSDNPIGYWDKNLDKPVKCFLVDTNGNLDNSHEYEYLRSELDKEIWLKIL